jgi:hypothetical protein
MKALHGWMKTKKSLVKAANRKVQIGLQRYFLSNLALDFNSNPALS